MKLCHPQTSRVFLDGAMMPADEQSFAAHLEACPACRRRLERAAGSDVDWQFARELATTDNAAQPGACDGETTPLENRGKPGGAAAAAVLVQPYLSPTDDPAMIGRIGGYEVVGVIGRGGMGIVLKAYERSLNRNVAVKLLDPTLANVGAARARFAREARAMAGVSHPHVVPVYAVDDHHDLPYFVMEYVVGETLEQRIARGGPLPVISTVRIALQVAEGLAAAHAQGLVHRDIKPGNILLDRGTERVRVADFGLARIASDASQTRSGVIAGTPQYMSPEQVRGETCDARSDLFSLGSVLYAMCTGHAPFRSETLYGTIGRVARDRPRPIREQNAETPRWLEHFVFRLLEKDRTARFESASDVATLLRAELSHLVNPLEGATPLRVWQRAGRRRRRFAAAGVLAALLTVTAIVWQAVSADAPAEMAAPPSSAPTRPTVNSPGPPRPKATALLWDVDGADAVRERVAALQQTLNAEPRVADPWEGEVAKLRAQLEALAADLEGQVP